MDKTIFN